MKGLILLLLIAILWNISNAEKCDCGKFYKKKAKGRKTLKNTRIFDGRTITKDEKFRYPWQIFLQIICDKPDITITTNCGGSLISRKHILKSCTLFF